MGKLDKLSCTDRNSRKRIFCNHGVDPRLLLDQGIQAGKQGTSSGQNNAAVKYVGCQFRWSPLQNVVYCVHDLHGRFL